MNTHTLLDKKDDTEEMIKLLTTQLNLYKDIHGLTRELNDLLLNNSNEYIMGSKLEEREQLIETVTSLKREYESVKEWCNSADNNIKAQRDTLLHEIQHVGNSIGMLDAENIDLIRNCIKNITISLEKIQEGKHLVSNLKKHMCNSPVFVDVCG